MRSVPDPLSTRTILHLLFHAFYVVQAAAVLTPSNSTHPGSSGQPASLQRAIVKEVPCSDLHWELRSPQTDGQATAANASDSLTPSNTYTDSLSYSESWPSFLEQILPTTQPLSTTNSQRNCDKDVPLERALVFEKEEERRPSLARYLGYHIMRTTFHPQNIVNPRCAMQGYDNHFFLCMYTIKFCLLPCKVLHANLSTDVRCNVP